MTCYNQTLELFFLRIFAFLCILIKNFSPEYVLQSNSNNSFSGDFLLFLCILISSRIQGTQSKHPETHRNTRSYLTLNLTHRNTQKHTETHRNTRSYLTLNLTHRNTQKHTETHRNTRSYLTLNLFRAACIASSSSRRGYILLF